MRKTLSISALFCTAFAVGFFTKEREIGAADPVACPQFECVQMSAWWSAGFGVRTVIFSGNGMPTTDAWVDTFAPLPTGNQPLLGTGLVVKHRQVAACIPKCGKDAGGVWQSRQEVTPIGAVIATFGERAQDECSPVPEGESARTNPNPVNNNPGSESPPAPQGPVPGGG